MNYSLLLAVTFGMVILFLLIIKIKFPAFISLLIASIITGLLCGQNADQLITSLKDGMGSTLGFVATVVGLGSIFGAILEKSGGANAIARYLIEKTGVNNVPYALALSGFLVSIPVFFDVGIIILFPMIAAMHKESKKTILYYAIPLFAGLAVSHAFIPPTPGPLAVTELLKADMMWVILLGFICGLPAVFTGGILFGKYISNQLNIQLKNNPTEKEVDFKNASPITSLLMILLPIVLIIFSSFINMLFPHIKNTNSGQFIHLIGHPFSALIIANIFTWVFLGKKMGFSTDQLLDISNKSLAPAGIIILVTGAGGVFKQILVDTGAGKMIAELLQNFGLGLVFFAFISATIIRVLQGSATVAMITAGGLVAPVLVNYHLSPIQTASLVIAIAAGATMLSHVNDSGFWLIKEYLQMDEKQGFKTWTMASSIIGITGFIMSVLVFYLG
ncbi:MAG: hypothetical protein RLZZ546_3183 [Bacteroidota bacterium]|jgi:Gnt-I system low-affinity gluconate transporter